MLIQLPKRVPMPAAVGFATLLMAAQVIEGTTLYLATLCFAFLVMSALAFNLAGGMRYPSGSYVAACSVLTVGLGMVVKVFLGESMQENLLVPEKTMAVYTVGMASMLAAVYVNSLMRPKRGLLEGMGSSGNATQIGIGCIIVAVGTPYILPDQFQGTFSQANYFILLGIIIPVFDRVRKSGGVSTYSSVALIAWGFTFYRGLTNYSKQGLFVGAVTWALAAVAAGYRASFRKLALICVTAVAAASILTPLSQVGRDLGRSGDSAFALSVSLQLLSHPLELRETYLNKTADNFASSTGYHMFGTPQGLLDRFNMFAIDDALIRVTDLGTKSDLSAIWSYFTNLIPRYLYPDKPYLLWGNVYAHQIGMLGAEDNSTGISFSPFSDAYHCAEWTGVTIIFFIVFLFSFYLTDAVGGCSDNSIWTLIFIVYNVHAAPEGMLGAPIYTAGTLTIFVIGVAVICARVVPLVGGLLSSPSAPMQELSPDGRRVQSV
jgi:hypothetical protein